VFIGHHAIGFASKRLAPRASLGVLMAAPLLLDLLWPIFLLVGIEHVRIESANPPFLRLDLYDYPWSHSLLMSVVWSALFGGLYWLVTDYTRGAAVIALGVFSHWVFDFIVHRPDLPLYPGGPKVGLGLWNSTVGTVAVEVALFTIGLGVYLRTTRARDRIGVIALWAFIVLLLLFYFSSLFGPPPPNWKALAWGANVTWLLLLLAHWFDRHRRAQDTAKNVA
jgi:hypothetical protein